jgi:uncharacterized repeat protein (TIGR03803 family)
MGDAMNIRALRAGLVTAVTAAGLTTVAAASSYTLKPLHLFCQEADCTDGANPLAPLLMAESGALYGTASQGGHFNNGGVVFQMMPNGKGYDFAVVHEFCQQTNCADGTDPETALIADVSGNLYGVARQGGANGMGVLFRLSRTRKSWTYDVLHSFCARTNCADGTHPATALSYAGKVSGAAWDGVSPLFGTTSQGASHGNGTVFALTPEGSGFRYQVIYGMKTEEYASSVLVDPQGSVIVAAGLGAKGGGGSLFRLAKDTWKKNNIYVFCQQVEQGGVCVDGFGPIGEVLMDAAGNLFGATISGGRVNLGTAYEISAAGRYKELYQFCLSLVCDDGANPEAGVVMDAEGHLFGTTAAGGPASRGNAYELSHDSGKWVESVIYDFCSAKRCRDGSDPIGDLRIDSSGNLIGVTAYGGIQDHGLVFVLKH